MGMGLKGNAMGIYGDEPFIKASYSNTNTAAGRWGTKVFSGSEDGAKDGPAVVPCVFPKSNNNASICYETCLNVRIAFGAGAAARRRGTKLLLGVKMVPHGPDMVPRWFWGST